MNQGFWRGKRVFLTGHTGFKGSWLSLLLNKLGAETHGYALAPENEVSLYQAANVENAIGISTIGNLLDTDSLFSALEGARPEIVIHMAAQALVRRSYADPVGTYATNVLGTVNLLEAIRHCPTVRAVIVVTSDKCYENKEWSWGYRENEPLGGYDPYSSSKACAELVTASYRQSFFSCGESPPAVASARAGNVIGGGDWAEDRLIPDIMRAVSAGDFVRIRNPKAIRPWQHVLEPLSGYLLLAEKLIHDPQKFSGAWNFGPADNDAKSVEWIVAEVCRLWGDGAKWTLDGGDQPHEAHYLKLDCSKARQTLGWRPKLDLSSALEWSVEWFQTYKSSPAAAGKITETQIDRYLNLGS